MKKLFEEKLVGVIYLTNEHAENLGVIGKIYSFDGGYFKVHYFDESNPTELTDEEWGSFHEPFSFDLLENGDTDNGVLESRILEFDEENKPKKHLLRKRINRNDEFPLTWNIFYESNFTCNYCKNKENYITVKEDSEGNSVCICYECNKKEK